jgi:hypothetical protein
MRNKPRYLIKKYILICVLSMTMGVISGAIILSILGSVIGYGSQAVLVIVLLSFPVCLFSSLYGFYKGLIRYYGFKGDEKLFFGGKF